MKQMIILGDGGHARSVIDSVERMGEFEISGIVVNDACADRRNEKYAVIGNDNDLQRIYDSGIHYAFIAIGYLGHGNVRNELYDKLKKIGFIIPVIIDPSAIIANNVSINEGTFVGKMAVINTGANIGKMCIVNTGAIIEHDCNIGDFTHIACGAILCGGVNIDIQCLVGAGSVITQYRAIEKNKIVPAGDVVR